MAKYDELTELIAKYFKNRRGKGITGTTVAKVITKKQLHQFPSLSGKMTNPFANRNFSIPNITRERRYYKFKEFEDDIVSDLTKMVKYVQENDIELGEKLLANLQYNLDLVKQLRRFTKESEDIFIKAGKNPEKILIVEGKAAPSGDESLVDSAEGLAESGRRLQDALDDIVESANDMRRWDSVEEVAKRKGRYAIKNEGKGFGDAEGYNRAFSRKLATMLDDQGIIKLDPKVRKGLDEALDMQGGHTALEYVDPIRVIREHFGDDIFETFPRGLKDTDVYTKKPKAIDDFIKLLPEPKKVKVGRPIDYLRPGEFQQRITDLEESIPLIERGDGFWQSPDDIQNAIKDVHKDIKTLKTARADAYPEYKGPFPKVDPDNDAFIIHGIDENGELNKIGRYVERGKHDTETGETVRSFYDRWDTKNNKWFTKESDYKFSSAYDKAGDEIFRTQDIIEGGKGVKAEGIMKEADPALVKERREGLKVVDRIPDDQMVQDLVDTQIYSKAEIDYMVELRGPESIGELWRSHVSKGHITPGKGDIKTGAKGKTRNDTLQEKMFDGLIDQWKKQGFTEDELRFALKDITTDMPADEAYGLMKKRALEIDATKSKPTVKGKTIEETLNEVLGGTASKPKVKKDSLSIRLTKYYDKELNDVELAQEGYNLQEIDVLKKARNIMKTEDQNPTEALRWVRGELADEAGEEIDDFMTDFPWDDQYAEGGRVGFKKGSEHPTTGKGLYELVVLEDYKPTAMEQILIDEYLGIPATYAQGGRVGYNQGMSVQQIMDMVNAEHGIGSLKLATDPSVVTNPNPGIANREMWNKFNRWFNQKD